MKKGINLGDIAIIAGLLVAGASVIATGRVETRFPYRARCTGLCLFRSGWQAGANGYSRIEAFTKITIAEPETGERVADRLAERRIRLLLAIDQVELFFEEISTLLFGQIQLGRGFIDPLDNDRRPLLSRPDPQQDLFPFLVDLLSAASLDQGLHPQLERLGVRFGQIERL